MREDYQTFLHALAKGTTDGLTSAKFPTTDKPVGWEHVLPWLNRRVRGRSSGDNRTGKFVTWADIEPA